MQLLVKAFGKLIHAAMLILLLVPAAYKTNARAAETVTYEVFYDNLSPFGKWLKDDINGYVWVPKVEIGFRPYFTNGSWKMTEYGSTWVSLYTWGWAPFHYGRWIFDSLYGWVWIPGLDWGPAWVVWRSDGEYYSWTPLTPGFSISQSFSPDYLVPADWWVFIPKRYLLNTAFQKYAKSSAKNNVTMLKSTRVINNTYTANSKNYICGPRAQEYAKSTGQQVTVHTIKNAAKPGKAIVGKEEITLYIPVVKKWESGQEPIPAKWVRAEHAIGKLAALGDGGTIPQPKAPAKKKKKA